MANDRPSIYGDFIRHGHQVPGGMRRRGWGARAAWLGGGVAMLGYGATRRSVWGRWLSYFGAGAMIAAGAVTRPMPPKRAGNRMGAWRSNVAERLQETEWSFVEGNVVVDRPIGEVYQYLNDFANWPKVFTGVSEAHLTPEGELTMAMQVTPTRAVWWRGRIVEDYPEQIITWQSVPDNIYDETGSLRFNKGTEDSTQVTIAVSFRIGPGIPGMAVGEAITRLTEHTIQSDLETAKQMIERAPQPAGVR